MVASTVISRFRLLIGVLTATVLAAAAPAQKPPSPPVTLDQAVRLDGTVNESLSDQWQDVE